jgi:ribose 5-phosphate isomerase B
MKIFLGADHGGFQLKTKLFAHLSKQGYDIEDEGDQVLDPADDYPQFAFRVTTKVLGSEDPEARGILLCTSGQGMCIAANRVHGIRAALVWDESIARETRNDNDSNVLCMPTRNMTEAQAFAIVDTWLTTPFSGAERHQRRIQEIEEMY